MSVSNRYPKPVLQEELVRRLGAGQQKGRAVTASVELTNLEKRAVTTKPREKAKQGFKFPTAPKGANLVCDIKNASYAWDDEVLFKDVNL